MSHHGFLILDKPPGITSRRALDIAQKWFPKGTRIGHAGTLDPLATGVLVVAVGRGTRLIEYVQLMEKEYHAVITLGATSNTDDADGTLTPFPSAQPPIREEIDLHLTSFRGEIDQTPPAFSAAKVEGRRAHKLARRGVEVDLAPRKVMVHEIRVLGYDYPTLELTVRCGKGTYIRSLARDLGQKLGRGGYILHLRRHRIGTFSSSQATPLDTPAEEARQKLLPLEMGLPQIQFPLAENEITMLVNGRRLPLPQTMLSAGRCDVAVLDQTGRLRAIADWDPELRLLRPAKVFKRPDEDGKLCGKNIRLAQRKGKDPAPDGSRD